MKKHIKTVAGVLALALAFSGGVIAERENFSITAPITASAGTYGAFEYNIKNGEAIITGFDNSVKDVIIPSEIEGLPVTSIGEFTFNGCSGLTSVTIPDSVMSIGSHAFYDCWNLTSVTIPNGVTSIGSHAFYECKALTSLKIPNSVTSIDWYAFYGCHNIKDVYIPESVTSIGYGAFLYCSNLEYIRFKNPNCEINGDITYKGNVVINGTLYITVSGYENSTAQEYAEKYGYKFHSLGAFNTTTTFTTTTTTTTATTTTTTTTTTTAPIETSNKYGDLTYKIEDDEVTITDCDASATEVIIPSEIDGLPVTNIGDYAFSCCNNLTSVIIPNGVTSIGHDSFSHCSNLISVTIPDSVVSIVGGTFGFCSSLTSITIPDSVTSIGGFTFNNCSNLTSVTILNPNCRIYDSLDTINNWYGNNGCYFHGTIYGYENSTAQAHAKRYGCKFSLIDTSATTTATTTTSDTTTTTTTTTPVTDVKKGDMNGDGLVDAVDASAILSYYAYLSTTEDNPVMDIDEFMSTQN
ncbi:MAG: leucine-rich repeat protein [Ruminococcus flavefaciens]|nr:leucine-rich repeat protein [Ruminococcus flavefaciens]